MLRLLGTLAATLTLTYGELILSEIQARNSSLKDGDGQFSDWIEIQNPDGEARSTKGWRLSDGNTIWPFPEMSLPAGAYLLVFASGHEDASYKDPAGYWHTNFRLGDGESLLLIRPDGSTAKSMSLPKQREGISFGLLGEDYRYFDKPTPGAANDATSAFLGFVADTRFSVDRGFHNTPFQVEIKTDTPGATIRYTLDSSTPSPAKGEIYTGPISISTTSVLRALAYREGYRSSNVDTHSYLFANDVALQAQSAVPTGYPPRWVSVNADYAMDNNPPDYAKAAGNANYTPEEARAAVAKSLLALPSLCITSDVDNWFHGTTGIYTHPDRRGIAWEKACAVELIHPDGKPGFHIPAGVRVQGLTSRSLGATPKLSLRVVFRSRYGASKLNYQVYPEIPLAEFNTIRLRSNYRDTWLLGNQALYVADEWVKVAARDMGQPYLAGTFWHVYINGLYWGIYNPTERPDGRYGESHFGGDVDEYDSVTLCCNNNLVEGDMTEWNDFLRKSRNNGFSTNEGYLRVQGLNPDLTRNPSFPRYLDVDHFCDYMILGQYHATGDWPGNFYVLHRDTPAQDEPFRFIQWDNDLAFTGASPSPNKVTSDAANAWWKTSPGELEIALRKNSEYRLRFADRVYKHLFNDGALTQGPSQARWDRLASIVEPALFAESARWGDRTGRLATVQDNWRPMMNLMRTRYFPQRIGVLMKQYRQNNLYPAIDPPEFSQHGGQVAPGYNLKFSAAKGRVYYTTDESDPRLFGGGVSPSAKSAVSGSLGPEVFLRGDLTTAVSAIVPDNGGLGETWRQASFDDAAWLKGKLAVGYDLLGGYTDQIGADLLQGMYGKNSSCYARLSFVLGDPGGLSSLLLKMKYDDGFVAYLNGSEIARANAPEVLAWNSSATADRPDAEAAQFSTFDILSKREWLRVGTNVIAIQGLNIQPLDDDFLLAAALEGQSSGGAEGLTLTQPTIVKARVLDGDVWSALHEANFLVGQVATASNLKITEVYYDPEFSAADLAAGFTRSDFEFIELTNFSQSPVILAGLRFSDGVEFAVSPASQISVPAGGSVIVAGKKAAILHRYGQAVADKVIGEFGQDSGLSGNGERLEVLDASSKLLSLMTYDNKAPWANADGADASLTLGIASDDPTQDATRWRASLQPGGTPGVHRSLADEWRAAHFTASELADQAISGDSSDPDGDGFPNGMEQALGLPPKSRNQIDQVLQADRKRDGKVELEWRDPVDNKLSVQPMISKDLRTWQDIDLKQATDEGPAGLAWRKRKIQMDPQGAAFLRLAVRF